MASMGIVHIVLLSCYVIVCKPVLGNPTGVTNDVTVPPPTEPLEVVVRDDATDGSAVETGHVVVTPKVEFMTSQGEMVTSQGEIVTSQGEMVTSQGEIVTSLGETATSQGESLRTPQGEVVTSNGGMVTSAKEKMTSAGGGITPVGSVEATPADVAVQATGDSGETPSHVTIQTHDVILTVSPDTGSTIHKVLSGSTAYVDGASESNDVTSQEWLTLKDTASEVTTPAESQAIEVTVRHVTSRFTTTPATTTQVTTEMTTQTEAPSCEADEYQCINRKCIPLDRYNNTVNDCGDNSDEFFPPCKSPGFSCLNGRCIPSMWYLDGTDDCQDASDEAKIVGTSCTMIRDCCYCEDYVPNSECLRGTCQCSSGFYSNTLGTQCHRRVIGDRCELDSDCYDAFSNSSCVDGACACDVGYYDSDNRTSCIRRLVGDDCGSHIDCTTVIPNSNCSQWQCRCNSGFHHQGDLTTCLLRKIGEICRFQHECFGVANSQCDANTGGACACLRGYVVHKASSVCRMRLLEEPCEANEDCLVTGSVCRNQQCACASGRYPEKARDFDFCHRRKVRDVCVTQGDCVDAMENSHCDRGRCACTLGAYPPREMDACNVFYDGRHVAYIATLIVAASILVIVNAGVIYIFCIAPCIN